MSDKLAQFASIVRRNGDEFSLVVPKSALDKIGVAEGDDVIVEIRKYLSHIEYRGKK
jgi:hypothetical protein